MVRSRRGERGGGEGVAREAEVKAVRGRRASSSTRLTELQKMIDWLICSFEKSVLRQWTFCFSSTNA